MKYLELIKKIQTHYCKDYMAYTLLIFQSKRLNKKYLNNKNNKKNKNKKFTDL